MFEFRQKLSTLLIDTVVVPSSKQTFNHLLGLLWREPQPSWQQVERTLFMVQVIGRNIDPDEEKIGTQIMYFLETLPTDCPMQLRLTAIETMNQFAEWVNKHPDKLSFILTRLMAEIQVPELASCASVALGRLCDKCRLNMAPYFETLHQLVQYAMQAKFSPSTIERILKVNP